MRKAVVYTSTAVLILFLFLGGSKKSYSQSAPKYSNEFLAVGVGARSLAMANSSFADGQDVTAAYWNPASLLGMNSKYEIGLMHAAYFGGIANYDYAGFASKKDSSSAIALSVVRFGIDDIPDTRFLIDEDGRINYDNVGSFAEASYGFFFSYARRLNISLKKKNPNNSGEKTTLKHPIFLGANAKVIHRTAGDFASVWGFGLDFSAFTKLGKWKLALTGRDITSTFNAWTYNTDTFAEVFSQTDNEIPVNSVEVTLPRLLLGIARPFDLHPSWKVTTTLALETTFDGKRNTIIKSDPISAAPSFGAELAFRNTAFLRGGTGNFQQIKDFDGTSSTIMQPNFGLGFRVSKFVIDYALTNVGETGSIPYSHVFSLRVLLSDKDLEFLKKPQK